MTTTAHKRLVARAAKIADMIAKTDTDVTGELLSHVAMQLRNKGQNYTSAVISESAVRYGLPKVVAEKK